MPNKLLLYFSKIQARELPKLEAFVRSPFFNTNQAVLKMMVDLISVWPDLPKHKEELYALAYPNESYNAKEFRYLISDSAALISRFWSIQFYEKNKPQKSSSIRAIGKLFENGKFWRTIRNQISRIGIGMISVLSKLRK